MSLNPFFGIPHPLRTWPNCLCCLWCYRVVIIFIIIKIFFYVCWYRSRQRQLAAYLSNPRNAQIVIVGGRAYLHQMCERQNVSTCMPPVYPHFGVVLATIWGPRSKLGFSFKLLNCKRQVMLFHCEKGRM